jgi:hypothetical protein
MRVLQDRINVHSEETKRKIRILSNVRAEKWSIETWSTVK